MFPKGGKPMKSTEAVVFDLEGTLFNSPQLSKKHREAIMHLIAAKRSVSYSEAEKLFSSVRCDLSIRLGYEPPMVTTAEGLGINHIEFFQCIESIDPSRFIHPDHGLKGTLLKLRQLCKVGLLTNVSRKTVIAILHALGLDLSEFDAIVSGDEVLENKPALNPFLKLVATLHVQPNRVVMVGDRIAIDLIPAKRLGIATILVDKSNNLSPFADIVVNDVTEVYSAIFRIEVLSGGCQIDNH
jgi:FMN phosphatase YigB (HAD superfamily)